MGLSVTLLGSKMGARVIALDVEEERLQRAKKFGTDLLINPNTTGDVVQTIRDATKGLEPMHQLTALRLQRHAPRHFNVSEPGEKPASSGKGTQSL